MNIYILTGYDGELLDPVLSFSYDEIFCPILNITDYP